MFHSVANVAQLVGLPAFRCSDCGGLRFVNVGGVPTCEDCGDFDPFSAGELLQAEPVEGRLRWKLRGPDLPPEGDDEISPRAQVFVSRELEVRTFPLGLPVHDVIEIGITPNVSRRFARLDRDVFRILANAALDDPDFVGGVMRWRRLVEIGRSGVEFGVLGKWAGNQSEWHTERMRTSDGDPFRLESELPELGGW